MIGRRDAIEELNVRTGAVTLRGKLAVPPGAVGIVVFGHGCAAYRNEVQERDVARALRARGLATVSIELLMPDERPHELVEIELLADRLVEATDWLAQESHVAHLPIAYLGEGTGAAAALVAAARRPELVRAVIARGGRADHAGVALSAVHAPTLLVVSGDDDHAVALARKALARMTVSSQLASLHGDSDAPGTSDEVAELAGEWIIEQFSRAFAEPHPRRAFGRQFPDRRVAGERLSLLLQHHAGTGAVVFGLPRGGIVVAEAVARSLGLPLDVWLVAKLGMPIQPELGMGALAEGAALVLDPAVVRWSGAPPHEVRAIVHAKGSELRRRAVRYRGDQPPPDVRGQTAILVDDGIVTPGLLAAAIRGARKRGAAQVVVATPVAAAEAVTVLRAHADEVVALATPTQLIATGAWYEDFRAVGEQEIVDLLTAAKERNAAA